MSDKSEANIRKAHCSSCGGVRNCDVRAHYRDAGEDGDGYYLWWKNWYILQCRGCETVFVQTVSANSEDIDYSYDENGETVAEPIETIVYWPILSKRTRPEWLREYGIDAEGVDALDQAITELYRALDNDLAILSAIGMRTCFDVAAIILGIDSNLSFSNKLDELVRTGKIGAADKDRLAVLVEAGSASIHRGWQPSPRELETLIEVLEHFVFETFVAPTRRKRLDEAARKLKAKVPPRPERQRRNAKSAG